MIILICGKAGAGKDTIGNYLSTQYGFHVDALAAPIKRLVGDVFVIPKDVLYDRNLREQPMKDWDGWTVRKLLQIIGTELFRKQICDDIWVRSLWLRIREKSEVNWAVTDVRFPNEQEFLQSQFKDEVVTFKVQRPGHDGSTKGGIKGHESEAYDLPADYVIDNSESFDHLYDQVDKALKECKVRRSKHGVEMVEAAINSTSI